MRTIRALESVSINLEYAADPAPPGAQRVPGLMRGCLLMSDYSAPPILSQPPIDNFPIVKAPHFVASFRRGNTALQFSANRSAMKTGIASGCKRPVWRGGYRAISDIWFTEEGGR